MPQPFSWTVLSNATLDARRRLPGFYAVTRALDPVTGSLVMDGATWRRGAPMVEVALRVLRTERGSCPLDPGLGVVYDGCTHVGPGVARRFEAALREAFKRYTDAGLMEDLQVRAEVKQINRTAQLLAEVAFVDPRAEGRVVVTGRQT